MSALSIQPTYPIFTETDGQPLEDGYIWIGQTNLDPQANPINVYFDAALTIPAGQPIRTLGGYPSNSGTPARLYVNSDYSIRVMNKNGSTVYSAPSATERYSGVVVTGINAEDVIYDPPFAGAVQTDVETKLSQLVSVVDFGATGDGVTDDSPAVYAAATYLNSIGGGTLYFPPPEVKYALNPQYYDGFANITFWGEGAQIVSRQPGPAAYGPFHMINCSDISFVGLDIDGNYPYWATQPVHSNWNNFNLVFVDCVRVKVQGCYLHDSGYNTGTFDKFGDGVYITGTDSTTCNNFLIDGNIFKDDGRWSVAVLCGSYITITNNVATRSSASSTAIGFIDFEYNLGVGSGYNIIIANNQCNGACEIVSSQNAPAKYYNMSITGNTLSGFYSNGAQRAVGPYTQGIGISRAQNLTISNNIVYGVAGDSMQVNDSNEFVVSGNVIKADDGSYYGLVGIYSTTSSNGVVSNNKITMNSASGFGVQFVTATDVSICDNLISNPANWGVGFGGNGASNQNRLINNTIVAGSTLAFDVGGSPTIVMGNVANTSGRLDTFAHTVMNNAMTISTIGGTWYNGGGTYRLPDNSLSRNMVWLTAAPVAGTWAQGDIVKNSAPSVGQPKGWVCTVAGTPGTWVSEGNL